jgi:hypothetical protein
MRGAGIIRRRETKDSLRFFFDFPIPLMYVNPTLRFCGGFYDDVEQGKDSWMNKSRLAPVDGAGGLFFGMLGKEGRSRHV